MRPGKSSTGSTHHGLHEWMFMRLSAVYMAAFTIYVASYWISAERFTFETWRGWFESGSVRVAWALFIGLLLLHGWFGIRSVLMDYIKPIVIRILANSAAALGLMALAIWAAAILLRVPG